MTKVVDSSVFKFSKLCHCSELEARSVKLRCTE